MTVDNVSHDGIQNGIAQKFQPLVVHRLAFFSLSDAAVHQCLPVILNVVGIESGDVVQCDVEFFVFPEGKTQPVKNVFYAHSFGY